LWSATAADEGIASLAAADIRAFGAKGPDQMRTMSKDLRRILLSAAIIVGAMFAVGLTVSSIYPDDWRAVEASVQSSRVIDVSSRTSSWALEVNAGFEISGRRHEGRVDVFRDPERSVTEAEASKWPAGRAFTLYSDANNPESVSLAPDGGRRATVVTAVILTPLVVLTIGFVVFLFRRIRAKQVSPSR
jgi:hypothetical protein